MQRVALIVDPFAHKFRVANDWSKAESLGQLTCWVVNY